MDGRRSSLEGKYEIIGVLSGAAGKGKGGGGKGKIKGKAHPLTIGYTVAHTTLVSEMADWTWLSPQVRPCGYGTCDTYGVLSIRSVALRLDSMD